MGLQRIRNLAIVCPQSVIELIHTDHYRIYLYIMTLLSPLHCWYTALKQQLITWMWMWKNEATLPTGFSWKCPVVHSSFIADLKKKMWMLSIKKELWRRYFLSLSTVKETWKLFFLELGWAIFTFDFGHSWTNYLIDAPNQDGNGRNIKVHRTVHGLFTLLLILCHN